jgi:hypothetical protein
MVVLRRLIRDARQIFRPQGEPTANFGWMSREVVSDLLPRLGFSIELLGTGGRDTQVEASKSAELSAKKR